MVCLIYAHTVINHLCTYAHQTELSVCYAQTIAE